MTIRLVAFDFDQTLASVNAPSSWQLIDKELNCFEDDKSITSDYHTGKISYAEWSRQTAGLYRKYGLTKERFDEILDKNVKPMEGVMQVLGALAEKEIKTAIISGSLLNIYDFMQKKFGLKVDKFSFASQFYFDKNGNLSGGEFNDYDYEGKVDALRKIAAELGITLEETAFVGDYLNDIFVFNNVALSFAFRPQHDKVKEAAKVIINDMTEILKYV